MKSWVLSRVQNQSRQGRLLVAQDEILGIGLHADRVPLGTAETPHLFLPGAAVPAGLVPRARRLTEGKKRNWDLSGSV